jgi:hypothetical protein
VRRRQYTKRKRLLKKRNTRRRLRLKTPLDIAAKRIYLGAADSQTLAQQKANSSIATRRVAFLAQTGRSDKAVVKFVARVRREKTRKIRTAKPALRDVQRTIWYNRPKASSLSKTFQLKPSKPAPKKRIAGL